MTGTLLQMSGAVVDLVYRIEALPEPGSEALASSSDILAGGGFNAMVAAARAGLSVTYGGGIGTGPFADIVRTAMASFGFPVLQTPNGSLDQGSCVVLVDATGERSFVSKDGAEGVISLETLAPIAAADFNWLLLSGYTLCYRGSRDALRDWVNALPAGAGLVFDPSPAVGHIPEAILRDVLAKTSWISCNGSEARAITGLADPQAAIAALLCEHCPQAAGAVLRLGADGCLVALSGASAVAVPGFAVSPVVDTNGAGDTHIGAFLAALTRGEAPVAAARTANAAAALSTLRNGPATAPNREETQKFLTETIPDPCRSGVGAVNPDAARSETNRRSAGGEDPQPAGHRRMST